MLFNGHIGYDIQEGDDTHTVDLDKNTFTYRAWDILGILCEHAICALVHNKQEPIDQISSFYHIYMYSLVYQFKIMPLRSKRFYKMDQYLPIEPPPMEKKNRGRAKTNRRREEHEQRPKKLAQNLKENGYMLHAPSTSKYDTTNDRTRPGYPSKVPQVVPPSEVPLYNP